MWRIAQPRGFVAYISAITLSAALLTLAATLSLSLWYAQSSMREYEYAERSVLAARECADTVIAMLIQDAAFAGNIRINATEGFCEVGVVEKTSTQYIFSIIAVHNVAHRQAQVVVDAVSLTIRSWRVVS